MENQPQEPRVKGGKRSWLRLIFWIFAGSIILLTALGSAVYFYRDEIKASIISELNRHLQAEVRIAPSDIDITFISTFPQCALEMKNVLMFEALKQSRRDTLLFASGIRLRFNISDLWHKRYIIRGLSLNDAVIKPVVFADGSPNYVFWKTGSEPSAGSTRFVLDDFQGKSIRVEFSHLQRQLTTIAFVRKLKVSGDFSADRFSLSAKSDVRLKSVTQNDIRYVNEKNLSCGVTLDVNDGHYLIKNATLQLNDLKVGLDGGFALQDGSVSSLAVNYSAPDLDIASLLSLLPENHARAAHDYSSSGNIYLNGNVRFKSGRWSGSGTFGAKNTVVKYVPGGTSMEDVNLDGSFEAGESQRLELKRFSAHIGGGVIKGAVRLTDFNDPRLVCELHVTGDLEKIHGFFPADTIRELRGNLELDLELAGRISAMKRDRFAQETVMRGECRLSDLFVGFVNDKQNYSVKQCGLTARNGEISVTNLMLRRGASDLTINGRLPGLIDFLLGNNDRLKMMGTLRSDFLQVDDFIPENSTSPGKRGDLIPANLELEMSTTINQLAFGKFSAADVKGELEIRNRKLMVSDLFLNTMQGSAKINALADNTSGGLSVAIESRLEKINVSHLFAQMNNFGQATLQDSHIRGFVTADINFSGLWNSRLESDPNSIRAGCDLVIDKGELVGFRPLFCLGKFVEVRELENVRFSQLRGRVEIADKIIAIPQTSIKNSAVNLEFSGSHTFGHEVDYHFRLLMSDLFAARHKSLSNTEFGEVERDSENRRSVYVMMTGPLDDPKIRYDRKGLKQKIRNDIAGEKQQMKTILREEFGLFKKSEPEPAKKKQPEFRLETQAAQPQTKKELVLKKREEEDF